MGCTAAVRPWAQGEAGPQGPVGPAGESGLPGLTITQVVTLAVGAYTDGRAGPPPDNDDSAPPAFTCLGEDVSYPEVTGFGPAGSYPSHVTTCTQTLAVAPDEQSPTCHLTHSGVLRTPIVQQTTTRPYVLHSCSVGPSEEDGSDDIVLKAVAGFQFMYNAGVESIEVTCQALCVTYE